MKNKITLLFFVINISIAIDPISAENNFDPNKLGKSKVESYLDKQNEKKAEKLLTNSKQIFDEKDKEKNNEIKAGWGNWYTKKTVIVGGVIVIGLLGLFVWIANTSDVDFEDLSKRMFGMYKKDYDRRYVHQTLTEKKIN